MSNDKEVFEFNKVKIDKESVYWDIFPFDLKSPEGEEILSVDREQNVFVCGNKTEDEKEIGQAFKEWADRWNQFQKSQ
jgi:hypothetical protein